MARHDWTQKLYIIIMDMGMLFSFLMHLNYYRIVIPYA